VVIGTSCDHDQDHPHSLGVNISDTYIPKEIQIIGVKGYGV